MNNLISRVIPAFAVLTAAAIPVGALTVKNTSSNEVSVAVDTGSAEAVYKVPANGSVDVKEDCSSDCAVTGPWGYSRMVSQNATIETDGTSLVTATAAPAQALIPQNPVEEPDAAAPAPQSTAAAAPSATTAAPAAPAATAASADTAKPAATPAKPRRKVAQRKPGKQVQKGGPGAGSLQLLFEGPGKK